MRAFLAALSLALLAASAVADDVTTKAGSVYAGKILSEDEASVTIDTPALGRLRISRADIAKVRRDAPVEKPGAKAATPTTETPAEKGAEKPAAEKAPPKKEEKTPEQIAFEKAAAARAAAAKAAADEARSAQEREERRKTSKIVRRTTPTAAAGAAAGAAASAPSPTSPEAAKPSTEAAAAPPAEKASFGGAQLAQVEPGSWIIVFQPPKPFDPAPAGLQLGRRLFARVESIGSASAWLAEPQIGGRKIPLNLADVQCHFVTTPDASRVRLLEGIDQGAWLRLRLDDGTVVQGVLKAALNGSISLAQPGADGKSSAPLEIPDKRVVELDGLLRSTATKFALTEAAVGEPVALTTWPDGREVVGVLKERDDKLLTIESQDGAQSKFAVDGPIAELRRVPGKWRVLASNLDAKNRVHAKSVEEFTDARVERDLVGRVVSVTAYAATLDTPEGALVLPFESMTAFEVGDFESVPTKPMKQSERPCQLPAVPGDPAEKAKGYDANCGVSIVGDGETVKHVFVSAPFAGEVFGIKIHDKVADALDRTDLRFDSTVVPKSMDGSTPAAAETTSNSLAGMRVTLVLDREGTVSAIEVAAR